MARIALVESSTPMNGVIYEKTFYDSAAAGDKVQDIVPASAAGKACILGIRVDDQMIVHSGGTFRIYSDDATAVVALDSTAGTCIAFNVGSWIELNVATTAASKKWIMRHATGPCTYAVRWTYVN